MQWRSWFRLLPGMDWYSRIRSGVGVQRSREWNLLAGRLTHRVGPWRVPPSDSNSARRAHRRLGRARPVPPSLCCPRTD